MKPTPAQRRLAAKIAERLFTVQGERADVIRLVKDGSWLGNRIHELSAADAIAAVLAEEKKPRTKGRVKRG